MKFLWQVFSIAILFLAAGCTQLPAQEPLQTSTPSAEMTPSDLLITNTPTSTNTTQPTSSSTPQPTPTFTPTYSPTPQLPVSLQTSVPMVHQTIGADNASRIQLLASYERFDPGKTLIKLTSDGKYYFIVSSEGIDVYDAQSRQTKQHYDITLRLNYERNGYYSNDLQISQDGNRFMARVSDGKVAIYDVDGTELFNYEFPPELYDNGGAALSPDGKHLALDICSICNAFKGKSAFRVIDIDSGDIVYENGTTPGGEAHGYYPVFSPDGKILATEFAGQVTLWNTTDWKRLTDFSVGSAFIGNRIYFSPDSTNVAVMGDSEVYVWRLEDHRRLRVFEVCGSGYNLSQAIFSPDNAILAVLNCKNIDVWKIADGSQISEQETKYSSLTGMQLGNDGKVVEFIPIPKPGITYAPWNSWYYNSDFRYSGSPPSLNFVSHSYPGNACSISLDGQPNCAEGDFIIGTNGLFYRAISENKNVELRSGLDDNETILSFLWAGYLFYPVGLDLDHQLFFYDIWTDANSSTVYVMDTATGQNIGQWPKWISNNRIVYSPDGALAAFYISMNPGTRFIVYDLANRKTVFQISSPWNNSPGTAFTPDGKYLAYFMVQPGEKFDFYYLAEVGKWTNTTKLPYEPIKDASPTIISYSSDGALLAIGFSNGIVRLYNPQNDQLVREWKANNDWISGLAFSQDTKYLASSSNNGTVRIWGIWP